MLDLCKPDSGHTANRSFFCLFPTSPSPLAIQTTPLVWSSVYLNILQMHATRVVSRLAALIPPKIASPSAIGATQSAARMTRVVDFYSKVSSQSVQRCQSSGQELTICLDTVPPSHFAAPQGTPPQVLPRIEPHCSIQGCLLRGRER